MFGYKAGAYSPNKIAAERKALNASSAGKDYMYQQGKVAFEMQGHSLGAGPKRQKERLALKAQIMRLEQTLNTPQIQRDDQIALTTKLNELYRRRAVLDVDDEVHAMDKQYDEGYKKWLNADDIETQEIEGFRRFKIRDYIPGINAEKITNQKMCSYVRTRLHSLYEKGPKTAKDAEHYYRYLIWPVLQAYEEVRKYNSAERSVFKDNQLKKHVFDEQLWLVEPGTSLPQLQSTTKEITGAYYEIPGNPALKWPASLVYAGKPGYKTTASYKIPPCLQPAINPWMRGLEDGVDDYFRQAAEDMGVSAELHKTKVGVPKTKKVKLIDGDGSDDESTYDSISNDGTDNISEMDSQDEDEPDRIKQSYLIDIEEERKKKAITAQLKKKEEEEKNKKEAEEKARIEEEKKKEMEENAKIEAERKKKEEAEKARIEEKRKKKEYDDELIRQIEADKRLIELQREEEQKKKTRAEEEARVQAAVKKQKEDEAAKSKADADAEAARQRKAADEVKAAKAEQDRLAQIAKEKEDRDKETAAKKKADKEAAEIEAKKQEEKRAAKAAQDQITQPAEEQANIDREEAVKKKKDDDQKNADKLDKDYETIKITQVPDGVRERQKYINALDNGQAGKIVFYALKDLQTSDWESDYTRFREDGWSTQIEQQPSGAAKLLVMIDFILQDAAERVNLLYGKDAVPDANGKQAMTKFLKNYRIHLAKKISPA